MSITQDGLLDLPSVEAWVGELLRNKGTDMYRMKGVLNVKHGGPQHLSSRPFHPPALGPRRRRAALLRPMLRARPLAPPHAQRPRSLSTTPST